MVTLEKNSKTQTSWFKIIICFIAGVLLASHTGKIPGAIPLIQGEFNLSLTKVGNSFNHIDLDFNKKLKENWSFNFGLGLAQKSSSGFNSNLKFNTELNF